MALQLIYTSAPRLLEAGRTGFGTVARHRAVSGLLAAAVERFSQFARLPGYDPRRVVHCHRVLTVGATQYRVLSCLRDAGSDYTGRTNHIAHHLIAEEREVQALAACGITPADVLLAAPWRESWNGGARFLDPADEIDLGALAAPSSQLWQEVTGNQRDAGLPWLPAAQKGCYLVLPPHVEALQLCHESLALKPAQAWNIAFTTCLEPNDDLADFRWIGVSSTSPLRPGGENAARLILDLLQPGSLPAPPEEEAPPAPVVPPPPDSPSRERLPAPHLRNAAKAGPGMGKEAGKMLPPLPSAVAALQPLSGQQMPGAWVPQERPKASSGAGAGRRKGPPLGLIVAAAVIVALLASAGVVMWLQSIDNQQKAESATLGQEIESLWKKHHLLLETTRGSLQAGAESADRLERDKARQLLAGCRADFNRMEAALSHPGVPPTATATAATMSDSEVGALLHAVGQWSAAASAVALLESWSAKAGPTAMTVNLEMWLERRAAAWQKCASQFTAARKMPETKDLPGALVLKLVEFLKADAKPAGRAAEWRVLLQRMEDGFKPLAGAEDVLAWVTGWVLLETPAAELKKVTELCAKLKERPNTPVWLKALAEDTRYKMEMAKAPSGGGLAKPTMPVAETAPVKEVSVDSSEAAHPIYLYFSGQEERVARMAVPAMAGNGPLKLRVGGVMDAFDALKLWDSLQGSYRMKMMRPELGEITVEGQQMTLPVQPRGCRVVARTADDKTVLFEARVAAEGTEVLQFEKTPTYRLSDPLQAIQTLGVGPLLQRLQFVQHPGAGFSLVSKEARKQCFHVQPGVGLAPCQIVPATAPAASTLGGQNWHWQQLKKEIDTLGAEVRKLEEDIKALEGQNLAKLVKDERLHDLRLKKAEKESIMQAKAGELQAAEAASKLPPPPPVRLTAGRYDLQIEVKDKPPTRVCEIEVSAPKS